MGWVFLSSLLLVLCAYVFCALCFLIFGVCVFVVVWCFLAIWEDWPASHVLESSWKTLTRESCLLFCQETACAGCQCNEDCVLCAYQPVLASFHGGQQNWYLKKLSLSVKVFSEENLPRSSKVKYWCGRFAPLCWQELCWIECQFCGF